MAHFQNNQIQNPAEEQSSLCGEGKVGLISASHGQLENLGLINVNSWSTGCFQWVGYFEVSENPKFRLTNMAADMKLKDKTSRQYYTRDVFGEDLADST